MATKRTRRARSALDTVLINGRPIRYATAGEARAAADSWRAEAKAWEELARVLEEREGRKSRRRRTSKPFSFVTE